MFLYNIFSSEIIFFQGTLTCGFLKTCHDESFFMEAHKMQIFWGSFALLHASPIGFNRICNKVWHQAEHKDVGL